MYLDPTLLYIAVIKLFVAFPIIRKYLWIEVRQTKDLLVLIENLFGICIGKTDLYWKQHQHAGKLVQEFWLIVGNAIFFYIHFCADTTIVSRNNMHTKNVLQL